jgi:hypothetical protein
LPVKAVCSAREGGLLASAPRMALSAALAGLTLVAAGPAGAENDGGGGRVLTYVCKVDTQVLRNAALETIGTSCLDGMRYCNEEPGRGYCAPLATKTVTKTCEWVGLGMCRSR